MIKPFFYPFLILMVVSVWQPCLSQIPRDSIIPASALNQDLLLLKEAILQTHQNPYTYCSEEEVMIAYNEALEKVQGGQNYFDFARTCGDFMATFKDSHSSVNFAAMNAYIDDTGGRMLNIKVKSIDGGVYLVSDGDKVLHPGLELLKFNGHTVDELWDCLSDISVYEGHSNMGHQRITDALFPNLIAVTTPVLSENQLVLRNPISGDTTEAVLPAYMLKELKKKAKKKGKYKPYEFYIDQENSLGYIKIKTFANNKRPKYYKFLRQSYNRVLSSKVDNLVLDLRGNTGGLINRAEMLLSMYSDSTLHLPKNMISRQSNVSRKYYDKKYKGLNRWFINHFYRRNEKVASYKQIMNMEVGENDTLFFDEEVANYFPKFKGNSFVLMDGLSGSASVLFLAAFTQNNLGMTIGEPSLGPITGTWGNPTNFRLDKSGLNVLLSIIRTNTDDSFMTVYDPVEPEIHISLTPEDLYKGVDPEMEFVKNLIDN